METCAQKAQSQATALGIPMKCSVKNFGGYEAPVCNTVGHGMPLVDWFAVSLIGTGQTNIHIRSMKGFSGVVATSLFVDMQSKWGQNNGGYWDIDAGAYRKASSKMSYTAPYSCDRVMKVEGYLPVGNSEFSSSAGSMRLGQYNGGFYFGTYTGDKIKIVAQAPLGVKSASLYLLKNYEVKATPQDQMRGDIALSNSAFEPSSVYRRFELDYGAEANVLAQAYSWQSPQVAQKIGTVYFDASGVGTIDWTVPDLGPEYKFNKGAGTSADLSSLIEQIRMVADNGMWADSMHFKINKYKNAETCADPQPDGSCGTVNSRPDDLYDGMSIIDANGDAISRTFKPPYAAVVDPKTFNVPDDFISIRDSWTWAKLSPEYSKTFKPGDTVKLYAWTENLYTTKVDLSIVSSNQTGQSLVTLANSVPTVKSYNGAAWVLTYTFTIPKDLSNGTYKVRMLDPDYIYGFLGQSKTDPIYSGVAFSSEFTVKK
jgi:hypothetical protein